MINHFTKAILMLFIAVTLTIAVSEVSNTLPKSLNNGIFSNILPTKNEL